MAIMRFINDVVVQNPRCLFKEKFFFIWRRIAQKGVTISFKSFKQKLSNLSNMSLWAAIKFFKFKIKRILKSQNQRQAHFLLKHIEYPMFSTSNEHQCYLFWFEIFIFHNFLSVTVGYWYIISIIILWNRKHFPELLFYFYIFEQY